MRGLYSLASDAQLGKCSLLLCFAAEQLLLATCWLAVGKVSRSSAVAAASCEWPVLLSIVVAASQSTSMSRLLQAGAYHGRWLPYHPSHNL